MTTTTTATITKTIKTLLSYNLNKSTLNITRYNIDFTVSCILQI